MADDGLSAVFEGRFTELFEAKQKGAKGAVERRRATEAGAHQVIDGRLSSKSDKHGYVQLNVRVPLALKNQVVELRGRRKIAGHASCDVGEIVAEALRQFFAKQ